MRVVGYVRVSTDRQAEDGLGLDVQRDAIRKWATANGLATVTCGIAGASTRCGPSESAGVGSTSAGADAVSGGDPPQARKV